MSEPTKEGGWKDHDKMTEHELRTAILKHRAEIIRLRRLIENRDKKISGEFVGKWAKKWAKLANKEWGIVNILFPATIQDMLHELGIEIDEEER